MKGRYLLSLCIVIMVSFMLFRRKLYGVSLCRSLIITISASLLGLFGTYVMYYLENWEWGGQSFFGAVLFFPLFLLPISGIMRIPLNELLDYTTPSGLALLVPFKLNCYMGGCCGGKAIWFSENGIPTFFPSQLVEMAVATVITIVLLLLEQKKRVSGMIYPLCLILYGSTRMILNEYRMERYIYLMNMPAGSFWSLIAMLIGGAWLVCILRQQRGAQHGCR